MKKKQIIIETPEKIYFTYTLAEIGTRAAAYFIDLLIQIGIIIVLGILGLLSFINTSMYDNQIYLAMAVFYLLIFIFQWFYFAFFETVMNGLTPGKKACRIRVIKYNGDRLDLPSIVLRNLLRAADSIPFPLFNILGGFIALLNKNNKRLGDMVSGTLVVIDEDINIDEPDFETMFSKDSKGLITKLSNNNRLSEKDLFILRRVLNSRAENEKSASISASQIVAKLKEKYDLSIFGDKSDFEIIEEIYKAHTYED